MKTKFSPCISVGCSHLSGLLGCLLFFIFPALIQQSGARPLSEWERYQSESSMTAYLNRLVGTYIDPSIFHLSIRIQGNMNSESSVNSLRSPNIVREKKLILEVRKMTLKCYLHFHFIRSVFRKARRFVLRELYRQMPMWDCIR